MQERSEVDNIPIEVIMSLLIAVLALLAIRNPCSVTMELAVPLVGTSAPLGFFDPLGFSKTDKATLVRYREAELKHGRVAMLAVLGWLTQEHFHPLYDGKLSGNPLKAFLEVPPLGFVQIIILAGFIEVLFGNSAKMPGYVPGDYFGINAMMNDKDNEAWVGFQTRELNNGRLAMFAIMGEIVHAAITGKGALEQLGYVREALPPIQ